jgi:hypothetical protein
MSISTGIKSDFATSSYGINRYNRIRLNWFWGYWYNMIWVMEKPQIKLMLKAVQGQPAMEQMSKGVILVCQDSLSPVYWAKAPAFSKSPLE